MLKMYYYAKTNINAAALRLRKGASDLFIEERGDLVSSLGWMAIMALALVLIKSIVDGGLTGYANSIFSHLDRIFNI